MKPKHEKPKKLILEVVMNNPRAFEIGRLVNESIEQYDAWILERLENIYTQTKDLATWNEIDNIIQEIRSEK